MNLNLFIQNGTAGIMKKAGRYYLTSRKGLAFLATALPQLKRSASQREENETNGVHIPVFLIASIASQCNLHCAGCYARAGGACCGTDRIPDLTADEWENIFREASDLGVSFCLLAGGEPLLRRDVIDAASRIPGIIFPIFTNGTVIDKDTVTLFDRQRHLVPVLSVEGDQEVTDQRRGSGVYTSIEQAMQDMKVKRILFGISVTVNHDNMDGVLTREFIADLRQKGCGIVFYIEYVPAEKGTEALALRPSEQEELKRRVDGLKDSFDDLAILSFPGDEEAMGGCLASGRGFFHINPHGGAEPCPFSPYSKYNLKDCSIKEVLSSSYFQDLRTIAQDAGPHTGGCVLFQREQQVQALLTR